MDLRQPQDVQFYLPEQTVPEDAHMVLLAGGHPKKTSTIWKPDGGACEFVVWADPSHSGTYQVLLTI